MVTPVHPPTDSAGRPTWSVMIPVYNCAPLLERALGEVMGQLGDRDDVQIEIVDDGSDDDPAAAVDRLGRGRVTYHRNPSGLGAAANFNNCIARARGELVHILHGDDMVKPGFYAAMERALAAPDLVAAVCRTEYIDDDDRPTGLTRSERQGSGVWDDAVATLAISNRVRPAAIVVRRGAYERVGGFREDLPHAADWEMWVRLAASGRVGFVDEVLARYRVHDASDTAQRVRTGVNIDERLEAIEIIAAFVPASDRTRTMRRAGLYSALFAARTAWRLGLARDRSAAAAQLRAVGRCMRWAARPNPPRAG